jgi:hypothetical protein
VACCTRRWDDFDERTAYPQFPKLMMARELHVFDTPSPDEAVWARERTDTVIICWRWWWR